MPESGKDNGTVIRSYVSIRNVRVSFKEGKPIGDVALYVPYKTAEALAKLGTPEIEATFERRQLVFGKPETVKPVNDEEDLHPGEDEFLAEAIKLVGESKRTVTASMLQRRFKIGFARAAQILDTIESGKN